jgi:hypothetical protein
MKPVRDDKNHKAVRRLQVKKPIPLNQSEHDKRIIDLVLKRLYNCTDKNPLNLEADIYKPLKIKLEPRDVKRIWGIMNSTGLINPVIGFGNAGKVELTRSGYQLMSQFGSYKDYLNSLNNQQPQTVILPIQLESEIAGDANTDSISENETTKRKSAKK